MTRSAKELLDKIRQELAPEEGANRFVPLVAEGRAPLSAIGALAAEEQRIVAGDWRSLLMLAARAEEPAARGFFSGLAQGESLALPMLTPLAEAAGFDEATIRAYRPQPGCQAYSAYVAWLALNAEPAAAVLAMLANFAAWGGYCATMGQALRQHYGFTDEACAFFDFFATPVPELEEQALAAVQAGLDAGVPLDDAREHGRLLQAYELMFWNALPPLRD
ncbi:MAG TPA: transcriptional regulator [Actinophytocola sp.]|uniref:transcriptional regulator n=1 Tax=Actinophytocola sp. TaxID=1872138 RepID=UPI002DDD0E85|nr:transcriptional regulator [Actinophytocola sp.]HEV2781763.1 transcriptional regulator [Actinophytocola sp.]